jgi:hypothetical protein
MILEAIISLHFSLIESIQSYERLGFNLFYLQVASLFCSKCLAKISNVVSNSVSSTSYCVSFTLYPFSVTKVEADLGGLSPLPISPVDGTDRFLLV